MVLLAAFLGWMFDGVEQGLFGLTTRPALTEMLGPAAKDHIGTGTAVLVAVFLVGAALGGVAFGWLGDRIGRVRAMVWSVATYSLFSGACAFVAAPWQLALLRFGSSLGMGGEWALGVALIMEVWPGRWRPLLAGLIGVAANAGFLLIALLGLGLTRFVGRVGNAMRSVHVPEHWVQKLLANSGWRMLFVLGALPTVLTFLIRIFVPESERWRHAAAAAPPNRVADIFRGGLARVTLLGTSLAAIALLGTWGSVQWVPLWANRMGGAVPMFKAQMALGLGAMTACILAAPFAQLTNRRVSYFLLCAGSLASCAYLFRANLPYGWSFLAWVFIAGGFSASFYAWLPLYLPELFPTRVRATAQGFAYNAGRIFAAAGTFASGSLLNAFHEDYARMCSWISLIYVAGLVVIWFCPETKGRPLPA
jgi:MFS family permease